LQPPGWPAALCCWLDPLHPATRLHAAAARKLDGVNGSPALTSGWQTRRTVRGDDSVRTCTQIKCPRANTTARRAEARVPRVSTRVCLLLQSAVPFRLPFIRPGTCRP
jgi:hypothetical protein